MPNANHKPKGRFFRSVGLYLTDIMIDICHKWRNFWRKMEKKRAFALGMIYKLSRKRCNEIPLGI